MVLTPGGYNSDIPIVTVLEFYHTWHTADADPHAFHVEGKDDDQISIEGKFDADSLWDL